VVASSDSAGSADVAISIRAGTLITGLVGPIPCGCQTVSKMPKGAGMGGFGVEVVGICVFTGYHDGYWFRQVNCWGTPGYW
jgi:hypothetical protein